MKPALLILLLGVVLSACSDSSVSPGDGNSTISFELVVPQLPPADYYGVSGIRVTSTEIIIDTVVQGTARDLFAQFYRGTAPSLPTRIELNGAVLQRSAGTDTFRLGLGGLNLFGIHTWKLTDSAGRLDVQAMAPVDLLDTIFPLYLQNPIPVDVPLTLTWRTPSVATNGVMITWRLSGAETYQTTVSDNGRTTIPADIVARFRGPGGELVLTRFRIQRSTTAAGRSFHLVRIAQRNYTTLVFG